MAKKRQKRDDDYPRIKQLGVKIFTKPCLHIKWAVLSAALKKHGLQETFAEYFGRQTCSGSGPYPHDVEAVLERIASGKKTGSQLLWD